LNFGPLASTVTNPCRQHRSERASALLSAPSALHARTSSSTMYAQIAEEALSRGRSAPRRTGKGTTSLANIQQAQRARIDPSIPWPTRFFLPLSRNFHLKKGEAFLCRRRLTLSRELVILLSLAPQTAGFAKRTVRGTNMTRLRPPLTGLEPTLTISHSTTRGSLHLPPQSPL